MTKKKIKAVVTGGAGFIGAHLVDHLINEGWEVVVIDNLVNGKKADVNPKARLEVVDIREYEKIEPLFAGADYCFHFAALPRVQYSIEHPEETNAVNVTGTLNVLRAAAAHKLKRLVYSASSSAYGDPLDSPRRTQGQQVAQPLHEELPANPKSPYGLQKYIGELYCRVFNMVYNLPTVSLRYFNVYGPRQNPDGAYALVIGKFLKQHRQGEPLTITGDGEQTRDFTYVGDVVRANFLAATSNKVGQGEVINIGAGNNISINQIAKLIGGEVKYLPARLEPKHTLADNRLAKELLGWVPTVKIEEGIKKL
ncbi:MAG: NAD-dependent epimerase/dehydratase family protein [Patescibacteria group bacterium]